MTKFDHITTNPSSDKSIFFFIVPDIKKCRINGQEVIPSSAVEGLLQALEALLDDYVTVSEDHEKAKKQAQEAMKTFKQTMGE